MQKNKKIALAVIVLAVLAAVAYLLFLQAPPFEQEYKRMSLAWQNNGLEEERLHSSEKVFSLSQEEIGTIRLEIAIFASSQNPAIKDLSKAYLLFLESADIASEISEVSAGLAGSQKGLCENFSAYESLGQKFSELEAKKEAYLEAANSFVSKYPKEAELISLNATQGAGSQNEASKEFLEVLSVAKEVC